jgi:hypothetical protein
MHNAEHEVTLMKRTIRFRSTQVILATAVATALLLVALPTGAHSPVSPSKHSIAADLGLVALATTTTSQPTQSGNTNSGTLPTPSIGAVTPQAQAPTSPGGQSVKPQPPAPPGPAEGTVQGAKHAKLRIRVIDGRTMQSLSGAEIVIVETEQRYKTGADGYTPWFLAPIIRQPKFRPIVQELHGQLSAIAYKDGYRDSIHMGIRMHDGIENETTIWMYRIGPGDTRIEPVLYEVPYHHIFLIELADRFRNKSQLGEGFQKP